MFKYKNLLRVTNKITWKIVETSKKINKWRFFYWRNLFHDLWPLTTTGLDLMTPLFLLLLWKKVCTEVWAMMVKKVQIKNIVYLFGRKCLLSGDNSVLRFYSWSIKFIRFLHSANMNNLDRMHGGWWCFIC